MFSRNIYQVRAKRSGVASTFSDSIFLSLFFSDFRFEQTFILQLFA